MLTTEGSRSKGNLRMVGGSVMLSIPPAILDILGLRPNAKVAMSVLDGKLVVAPAPKPSYTLGELLAQCNFDAPWSTEEREWIDASPVGREIV